MEAAYRKEADCMIVPMPREVDHHVAGNMSREIDLLAETASPVRSCNVPEVMIVSPTCNPLITCTSDAVRIPVIISTGSAFPDLYR